MKTCSYCGRENRDESTACSQCGNEFSSVERVDPELTDPNADLVIVATFGDITQASIIKSRLEQEGIEACIPEELDPSPFGSFPPLAQVTVRVARKDLDAARNILATPANSPDIP